MLEIKPPGSQDIPNWSSSHYIKSARPPPPPPPPPPNKKKKKKKAKLKQMIYEIFMFSKDHLHKNI